MAQTDQLPSFEQAYDLCLYLGQIVCTFARYQKYALGADLRESTRRVLRLSADKNRIFAVGERAIRPIAREPSRKSASSLVVSSTDWPRLDQRLAKRPRLLDVYFLWGTSRSSRTETTWAA